VAALDPDLQKVYAEAVKVIPNLTPETLAGAKSEGSLTLYKLGYDLQAGAYPEFTKLFPFLKVTDFEAATTTLLQRFGSEARAGRNAADVVMSGDTSQVAQFDSEGFVLHYDPSSASAFDQGKQEGLYYPFAIYQLANGYNSDLVSEEEAASLESWQGILDPKWKGKAAVGRWGSGPSGMVPYFYFFKEKDTGFWDQLLGQQPLLFDSAAVMAERLGAGGVSVAFFANDGNLSDQRGRGAPIRWRYADPSLAVYLVQFIAKDAPHPNAAKLWVEWLLSKPGQSVLMKTNGLRTARTDMTDERAITRESWYKAPKSFYAYNLSDVMQSRATIQERWDRTAAQLRAGN
jgi:iron(III) transport system substrate-binding protein